jgi:hypothetical protein
MACVFQLGPKTNFGQSEQNPAYWYQLLLSAKQAGVKCTWYDAVDDKHKERNLTTNDWRIWTRFVMSFLINGVGYHILVHALPLQVAAQSSFTGVVFRAVGMMYLVDLDDTPGYTLTIVELPKPEPAKVEEVSKPSAPSPAAPAKMDAGAPDTIDTNNLDELSNEAQKIIAEAHAKLDALAKGKKLLGNNKPHKITGAGALLFAGITTPEPAQDNAEQEDAVAQAADEEAGQGAGVEEGTTFEVAGRDLNPTAEIPRVVANDTNGDDAPDEQTVENEC